MKKYILSHKVIFIEALIAEFLACLILVASYFIQMQLINTVLDGNIKKLVVQMVTMVILWIITAFFDNFIAEITMAKLIKVVNCDMRNDLSEGIKNMNHQEFHEKSIGEYISWYTNDVNQIEQLGFKPYYQYMASIIQVCIAVIGLFLIHWLIALIIIIFTAIMVLVPKIFDDKMKKLGSYISYSQDKFVEKIKDILTGFDVTKTFNKMNRFTKKMDEATNSYEEDRYKFAFEKNKNTFIVQVISTIFQLGTSFIIFLFAILKITPIGTVYGSGNLVNMLFTAIQTILTLHVSISASKSFFHKLNKYSSNTEEHLPELEKIQNNIIVENLSYAYDTKLIFDHANFNFKIGKKYALIGPSGSGKSTLLKLLLGQLKDYKGNIKFDGYDIKDYKSDSIFKYIAYISQDIFLFNTTIKENITLGDNFDDAHIIQALERSALLDDIKNMPEGLETVVGENGNNLSGGQKQRIAIARALIHNKSILLMDEGTSSLDLKNVDLVEDKLISASNITLILVSHHLNKNKMKNFEAIYEIGCNNKH